MFAAKQHEARWGIIKGSSKESQANFPKAAADCMIGEQRSQGGNHVGAETLELWERYIGERTNWDPIASGEMLFCWCREWGKHRPIYWGKIVLWWKKRELRADLAHSSLCNLISALGEDGWKQTLFPCQQPWWDIQCAQSTHMPASNNKKEMIKPGNHF